MSLNSPETPAFKDSPGLLVLRHRTWFIALFEAALVFGSLMLAWLLRFDFTLPELWLLFSAAPILIVIRLAAGTRFNLLHGWWRYTGTADAVDILKAVLLGSVIFVVLMRYVLRVLSFPISIYIIEPVLTAGMMAGVRLLARVLAESFREDARSAKKLILIGAGFAAQMIIREVKRPGSGYVVLCCLDDNPSKLGISIHGVPVAGSVDQLPRLLSPYPADEVVIAVPSATVGEMRRFVEICQQSGVRFKTVPSLRDLIAEQVTIDQIRDVDLNDLLGRKPVQLDLDSVRKHLENRVVLVTGAAGSIGSELCRQILDYGPARLLCLDWNENGIFYLEAELCGRKHADCASYHVADVRDVEYMHKLLQENQVRVIFHSAAYKHVAVMEHSPAQAVKNNVFALLELLNVAQESGCESFIMTSSDKAVNPSSIMGATKRIGELVLSSRPAGRMRCVSVRFGNVIGSNGSVVPILREQLRRAQPLTITHPEMRRFFMTIREAVSLVLQAFTIGKQGDILVLEMGEPVRILDLARTLARLAGKSEQDVEIVFTGVRDGEKLSEELFYPTEEVLPTICENIKQTRGQIAGWEDLTRQLEELRNSLNEDGVGPIRKKIGEIVPEFPDSAEVKR
ncbi:MAG: polysaccharide biosynthesis protein [Acidobacteria bacterium]|nr:polysaccharide biosynthesis protein [Acidobacteriota bacterium]